MVAGVIYKKGYIVKHTTMFGRALRTALMSSAVLAFAVPAIAQQQQAATDERVEEIVVTGSRIKTQSLTSSLTSNSPVTSLTAEEMSFNAPVAAEELIRSLPAVSPATGPGTNNGANGGAIIDIRNLDAKRSLVLLDGRRLTPFNLDGHIDTNIVPISLIERADLVTGGASAVYGADAVAGVVNFITKRNFEGLQFSGSYGMSDKSDAKRLKGDVLMGASFNDNRGNVVLSLGYTDSQQLTAGERPYGARQSDTTTCPGATGNIVGTTTPINTPAGQLPLGITTLSSTNCAQQGSGTTIPAQLAIGSGGLGLTGVAGQINPATGRIDPTVLAYNFNPDNLFQSPLERYQFTSMGRYELNDYAEVYTQVLYTRNNVHTQLASSGTFLNVYQVPIGNPFIPAAARAQICAARGIPAAQCVAGPGGATEVPITIGRRITELGPRLNDFQNKWFQFTIGARGDIVDNWSYDVYFERGEASQTQIRGNWGSLSKVQQALRAFNPTTCTNTSNGCVPLNVFGAAGSITPAMIGFINLNAILGQKVDQKVANASLSGDLGENLMSPFASLPIGVAVGAEYRKLFAANQSDGSSQIQGEVLGTGAPLPDRSGTFDLKEIFGEVLIPIVSDQPMMESLNFEGGYRRTKFTTTTSDTYGSAKFGGEWSPIQGLRFRGMGQRATRAPNVNELFAPAVSGLTNLAVDPCQLNLINLGQANTAGTLSNLCRLTGIPLTVIGTLAGPSAGQINTVAGGNTALGPEKAKTMTLGGVWTPEFADGLAVTLDYYKINLNKAIERPAAADVLSQCYTTAFNPSLTLNAACQQVLREPTNGSFNGATAPGIVRPLSNLGKIDTTGWDLNVTYKVAFEDMGMSSALGNLALSFNGSKVNSYFQQPTPSSIRRDCLGYYSVACDEPLARYRWNQRTTWYISDFDFSYNWRHMGATKVEPLAGVFFADFSRIKAYDYVDLSGGWDVSETARIALSITNVSNKKPPVVGNTIGTTGNNSGNTFPQSYDTIGRFFSLSSVVKF